MKVVHWWPGRKYEGRNPIPPKFLWDAQRRGSRYLTVAWEDTDEGRVFGVARCNPGDNPSRRMGMRIAVGRLQAGLGDGHKWGVTHCPICEHPYPTKQDRENYDEGEGKHLCWRGTLCNEASLYRRVLQLLEERDREQDQGPA